MKDLGWLVSRDTTVFPAAATMLAARAIYKYVTFVDKCLREFEIMPRWVTLLCNHYGLSDCERRVVRKMLAFNI